MGVAVGLRRGELLALSWDDVDLDGGSFGCGERSNACEVKVWCLGRQSRSDRVAASHYRRPRVRRCCLTVSAKKRSGLRPGNSWQESGLVFTTSVGTAVEPRNLSRTFEHLVQQSGVRRIRFHDLCASLLLAQGVSPRVVMDVLGHSQLSITMDSYSHVMTSALRDAADAMDRALSGSR